MRREARLIYNPGTADEQAHAFSEQIVVGRRGAVEGETEGRVTIKDPAISGRHCVIRQGSDGRFFIRDESRNGTRVQGRRLVPNVEMELHPGDRVQVAEGHYFAFEVDQAPQEVVAPEEETDDGSTRALINTMSEVTILVGDIRSYTTLNERFPASDFTGPLRRLFAALEGVIGDHQGTIKEYQGDAVFAFWERDPLDPTWHGHRACQCALALDRLILELAADPESWPLRDFALGMDWALTTGDVLITTIGADRVTGLAMVGDAVNYAFRLEKLADESTGRILCDHHTRARAEGGFRFRPLGDVQVKGRSAAEPVFALLGSVDAPTVTLPERHKLFDTPPGGLPDMTMQHDLVGDAQDTTGPPPLARAAAVGESQEVLEDLTEEVDLVPDDEL